MWPNPQETVDLVTFNEEIFNGKFYFLCSLIKVCTFSNILFLYQKSKTFLYLEVINRLSPGNRGAFHNRGRSNKTRK